MAPGMFVKFTAVILAIPATSIQVERLRGAVSSSEKEKHTWEDRRMCTKPVVDLYSKKLGQAIHRRVGYECSGQNYDEFSNRLDLFVANWSKKLGSQPFPLPDNSSILVLGNSHTRQLITTVMCQYADEVTDNSFDFEFGTERGDAFMAQFANDATIFSLTNCPVMYSKQWPQLVEKIIGRPFSSFDAILLGAFNNFEESINTSFYKAVKKASEGIDGLDFEAVPPPSLNDIASVYDGPILYVSMFAVQGDYRLKDAAKMKEALNPPRTNIELFDGRKYVRSLGIECGTDIEAPPRTGVDCDSNNEVRHSSLSHRCTGVHGGHVDLVAWDVIEAFHDRIPHKRDNPPVALLSTPPLKAARIIPPVELVVNAWNEDLSFIDTMFTNHIPQGKATIYCNGPKLKDERCTRVANYGTENWAYLKHIVDNYDQLANITVFTLASIDSPEWKFLKCRKLNFVLAKLDTLEKQAAFPGFSSMAHYDPGVQLWWDSKWTIQYYRSHAGGPPEKNCEASVSPLGAFYQKFLEEDEAWPKKTGMQYNGIFAARREMIHKHPKSKYQALQAELERCGEDVPVQADHYVERLWKPMLDRDNVNDNNGEGENSCPRTKK